MDVDHRKIKEKKYPAPRHVDSHQEQEKEYWDSFQYPILKRQVLILFELHHFF